MREKIIKTVDAYLREYPDIFSNYEKSYILDYFKNSDLCFSGVPDIIRELSDELGLLPAKDNIFLGFLDLVQQEFDLKDKHILEIGGGVLPRFAKRILEVSEVGKITVYDPRLSIYEKETDKLRLMRCFYKKSDVIEDVDLLVGLMPCGGIETLIDSALSQRKDFMIALCDGGVHGDEEDYFENVDEWIHSLIHDTSIDVEKQNMGKLKIKSLESYGDPYPVIYNKREK